MKLIYKGKYSGDEKELPYREVEGAVPFKEPQTMEALAKQATWISLVILFGLSLIAGMVCARSDVKFYDHGWQITLGLICSFLVLIPHEFIHAICFKGEVELFENLSQGMLFVIGTEDMSKGRFILMSLLPSIIFGAIPYLAFLIHPQFVFGAVFGGLSLSMGAGDFINVWNAFRQVPKNALIYLSGMHSYWYIPEER